MSSLNTLGRVLNQSDRIALITKEHSLSYDELTKLVTECAELLGTIVPAQQVITTSLTNSIEFAIAFLASTTSRAISAPLNPAYSESEIKFYLEDTKSSLVLLHKNSLGTPAFKAATDLRIPILQMELNGAGRLEFCMYIDGKLQNRVLKGRGGIVTPGERAYAREDDVALILHTSGTTGKPKGVPLTHLNLYTTMRNIVNTYTLTSRDRSYLVMPLFHVHGLLAGFLAPLLSGGSVVVPEKFSAGVFWKDFVAEGCTWYTAVPTIHQILLRSPLPSPIPKIRFIRSCSSALAPATFAQLEKTFMAPVVEAYAMTEAAHQMTSNPLPPHARKAGTVGRGQGVSIKILSLVPGSNEEVPEGEVAIKGLNVTPGYLNNPTANASSFSVLSNGETYFRTGDRGSLDSEGYLTLTGRLKELINRGGEKISPLEIDAVLLAVEGVAEAVAFGVEDTMLGEKVWAAVVLKEGEDVGEEELIGRLKGKISAFKCPERIFILKSIPKTATGKIQRGALAIRFTKETKEGLHQKVIKAKL